LIGAIAVFCGQSRLRWPCSRQVKQRPSFNKAIRSDEVVAVLELASRLTVGPLVSFWPPPPLVVRPCEREATCCPIRREHSRHSEAKSLKETRSLCTDLITW